MGAILERAKQLGNLLLAQNLRCAAAESCTGGILAAAITDLPGSSQWFERGFITYSNEAKEEMLAVPADIIKSYGAVSNEAACAMADGALQHSHADISVAITGIAGPDGGSIEKPVGTVWIAWARTTQTSHAQGYLLNGDRAAIRQQAALIALEGLINILSKENRDV